MPFDPTLIVLSLVVLGAGLTAGLLIARRRGPAGEADQAAAAVDQLHQEQLAHSETRTRLQGAEARIVELKQEQEALEAKLEARDRALAEKDSEIARAGQRLKDQQEQQADWDKARHEFLTMAKASVSETAAELSTKLLKDHKQENEAAKKEAEQLKTKFTAEILQKVEALGKQFTEVDALSRQNSDHVATVLRALSAPGTSGHAAQVSLGNVLKAFGLVEGRDYHLEYSVDGHGDAPGKLRPDAVVFLPSETVLVVDSKSSKHLLELAEAEDEGEAAIDAARQQFKRSMNQHLRDLTTKDYRAAVSAALREAGRESEARQVLTLMWLPNEGAVEKLTHADPGFAERAAKSGIYVVGPSGLWTGIGVAQQRIQLAIHQDSLQDIADETEALIDRIATMLEHAAKVGQAINRAADSYNKMAGSANSRVLPKLGRLTALGVTPPAKGLPEKLTSFTIQKDVIDAESELVEEPAQLFAPRDEAARGGSS
ncbi:MAG: DNA recombination protein RmuC [Marivibrio sp.]|uniref:DNA recombination protein RmuC n=1 Tax=Marivibrio sp. TaxID=2039719 RepID=UPI0032F06B74